MSKRKRVRATTNPADEAGAAQETSTPAAPPSKTGWNRFPIWAWVLIFIVPVLLSEYMFYMAGRPASMVLFPIAWAGFWAAMWFRSKEPRT